MGFDCPSFCSLFTCWLYCMVAWNCRYKDDIEVENEGTNGTLILTAVTANDAGVYKCTAETTAGVSQSDEAVLTIAGI